MLKCLDFVLKVKEMQGRVVNRRTEELDKCLFTQTLNRFLCQCLKLPHACCSSGVLVKFSDCLGGSARQRWGVEVIML